jgi:ketosteroid isomerase-like protein
MSAMHVEMLRRTYADWARGDFGARHVRLADDVEFVPLDDLTAEVRGPQAVSAFLRDMFESFSELRIEGREFVDQGDRVLVRVKQHVVGAASGATGDLEYWMEWRFDDAGDVVRFGAARDELAP